MLSCHFVIKIVGQKNGNFISKSGACTKTNGLIVARDVAVGLVPADQQ